MISWKKRQHAHGYYLLCRLVLRWNQIFIKFGIYHLKTNTPFTYPKWLRYVDMLDKSWKCITFLKKKTFIAK